MAGIGLQGSRALKASVVIKNGKPYERFVIGDDLLRNLVKPVLDRHVQPDEVCVIEGKCEEGLTIYCQQKGQAKANAYSMYRSHAGRTDRVVMLPASNIGAAKERRDLTLVVYEGYIDNGWPKIKTRPLHMLADKPLNPVLPQGVSAAAAGKIGQAKAMEIANKYRVPEAAAEDALRHPHPAQRSREMNLLSQTSIQNPQLARHVEVPAKTPEERIKAAQAPAHERSAAADKQHAVEEVERLVAKPPAKTVQLPPAQAATPVAPAPAVATHASPPLPAEMNGKEVTIEEIKATLELLNDLISRSHGKVKIEQRDGRFIAKRQVVVVTEEEIA